MSDRVKRYIQEAFNKARQEHAIPALPYKEEPLVELVQPIAEPVRTHAHRRVQYANQEVYHITDLKPEPLDSLFERAVKSLR